jgi:hypothetical protein
MITCVHTQQQDSAKLHIYHNQESAEQKCDEVHQLNITISTAHDPLATELNVQYDVQHTRI